MSAEKWTAGPWRAVQRDWGYADDVGGPIRRLWDVDSATGEPVAVASIVDENEANAHLIAAAPAMYEALDRLVGLEDDAPRHEVSLTRIHARAALALARGEPQP